MSLVVDSELESHPPNPPSLPSPSPEFGPARMIRAVCCRTRAVSSGSVEEDQVDDCEERVKGAAEGDGRVREEGINPIWPDMNV